MILTYDLSAIQPDPDPNKRICDVCEKNHPRLMHGWGCGSEVCSRRMNACYQSPLANLIADKIIDGNRALFEAIAAEAERRGLVGSIYGDLHRRGAHRKALLGFSARLTKSENERLMLAAAQRYLNEHPLPVVTEPVSGWGVSKTSRR
jgi:hypothetical protein